METRFKDFTLFILNLNRDIQRIKTIEMKRVGLKAIHSVILYNLRMYENLTSAKLSSLVDEDKAAVSRALKELSEKKFIKYDGSKYNAIILLTSEGYEISNKVLDMINKAVDKGGNGLTDKEREAFYKTLNLVCKNLDEYIDDLSDK